MNIPCEIDLPDVDQSKLSGAAVASLDFLAGDSEMAALMRGYDWAATSLGPPQLWPQPLRTVIRLSLNTRHPMCVFWGPTLACLYNDAYGGLIGPERHPSALGAPAHKVWAEIWGTIGPQVDLVMSGEGSTWHENHLVRIERRGRREDVYLTYGFSPIDAGTSPNSVGGVLVVTTETTAQIAARNETQEALRLAQKMEAIGRLSGGIVHDFNNMLQAIAGGMDFARRRISMGRSEDALEFLDAARDAAARATALAERLLAFGRRESWNPKAVSLDALIRGIEPLIKRTIGAAITVTIQSKEDCWPVHCDVHQMENAILNIAINGRDAMRARGGHLLIETSHTRLDEFDVSGWRGALPGEYVEMIISDTGTGMPPDVLEHALDRFFTTKAAGQGTGLGLSQLLDFVQQSNGILRLESQQGVGTKVHLFLPRGVARPIHPISSKDREPTATQRIGEQPPRAVAMATVLVVEDEASVRQFVVEWLQELGYRVVEAADSVAALRVMEDTLDGPEEHRISLLVTDIGLPGEMNGRQLVDAARKLIADLPGLLITGNADDAFDGPARLGPGMEILRKPFELEVLAWHVERMIKWSQPA